MMGTFESLICLNICLLSLVGDSSARSFFVDDFDSFNKAQQQADAGDSILWRSGLYQDVVLDILRDGIIFQAEVPGSVIFSGQSSCTVFADSVSFKGFQFLDGKIKGDALKVAGDYCHMADLNFSNYQCHYYLNVLPEAERALIRYCNFERKPQVPATSVVQIQVHESKPGYHRIQYCSFRDHTAPDTAGGDYGIEALRIGYSFQSEFVSRTMVEHCYFTRCNGDGEIISSKAHENVYRYNTFADNGESHFTLRHGSRNVVYGNYFLTGAGVRIKEGQEHYIYNNYFQTDERFSIRLMNHGANPLDSIWIIHNTFISGPLLMGGVGPFHPKNVILLNNLFRDHQDSPLVDPTSHEVFRSNFTSEKPASVNLPFRFSAVNFVQGEDDLLRPEGDGQTLSLTSHEDLDLLDIPSVDDDPFLELDIMGNRRSQARTAGCLSLSTDVFRIQATLKNTGPRYLNLRD